MLEQLSKPRTQHCSKGVLQALPDNLEEVWFGRATAPCLICSRADLGCCGRSALQLTDLVSHHLF